nr:hypothetical protein B0A51_03380 [Rachicladosporium sp. CCFEE 5018]
MADMSVTWNIHPGTGITADEGDERPDASPLSISLGASVQSILSAIKKDDEDRFPSIDLSWSQQDQFGRPIVLSLPKNGVRLQFDGADQRLRLIEITDFTKLSLKYSGSELVKESEGSTSPLFKRVYRLFGASFPGEYMAPVDGKLVGSYVLGWPGVAISFPVEHAVGLQEKDHVALLGSRVTSPADKLAIFESKTWKDARQQLFISVVSGPRNSALISRPFEKLPNEIEVAHINPSEREIVLSRRAPSPFFVIRLGVTTPQDLITELGAPDTKFKMKTPAHDAPANAKKNGVRRGSEVKPPPSSYSSTKTDTFDTDFDSADAEDDDDRQHRDTYLCYFSHGLDILVGAADDGHLMVKRVVIHGNLPGSAAFNRHRRLRWTVKFDIDSAVDDRDLHSEAHFEKDIKPELLTAYPEAARDTQTAMGRVINRCWDDSASESSFFLPDQDRSLADGGDGEQEGKWLGNMRLFQFPGLMFEVGKTGGVVAVYVGDA